MNRIVKTLSLTFDLWRESDAASIVSGYCAMTASDAAVIESWLVN